MPPDYNKHPPDRLRIFPLPGSPTVTTTTNATTTTTTTSRTLRWRTRRWRLSMAPSRSVLRIIGDAMRIGPDRLQHSASAGEDAGQKATAAVPYACDKSAAVRRRLAGPVIARMRTRLNSTHAFISPLYAPRSGDNQSIGSEKQRSIFQISFNQSPCFEICPHISRNRT